MMVCAAAFASIVGPEVDAAVSGPPRPRVVVTTDFPPLDVIPVGTRQGPADKRSDPDDIQSMVRFLLYANELEVEGLIVSSATLANVARKQPLLDLLDRYDAVDENLRLHDARYPEAATLRSRVWQGRDRTWGKPAAEIIGEGRDSEASEALVRLVDVADERPVWICVWGGPADLSQALWKVRKQRNAAELALFVSKLRVYLIAKQDGTADWLLKEFPDLFVICSERNYMGMFWNMHGSDKKLSDSDWVAKSIRTGHGPLGAAYPESGANPKTPGVIEGDSPSFLHLVSALRGINDPEKPDQAGWGGQFVRPDAARNHWFDHAEGGRAVYRWRAAVQAEFAERAEWMNPTR
jgi:hypothetical protein